MQRFGVTSNAIAPFAWTRMVNTIPADTPEARRRIEGLKLMDPNKIGPFVVALLSDEGRRRINGQIFVVRNNEIFFFSQSRPTHIAHTAEGCAAADHSRPRAADAGAAFSSRWGARVMSSPGRPCCSRIREPCLPWVWRRRQHDHRFAH
jgi:hypothetical protein